MKQLFKTCHVFRRSESFFAFGVLNTPYGGITVPPASKLPSATSASELGQTILRTLNGLPSQITEVNLATARQPYLAYLKESGFKSPAAFEKGASLIAAHFDGELYEVVPHQKDENGAFVAESSTKLALESSAEEIGKAVLAAFDAVH